MWKDTEIFSIVFHDKPYVPITLTATSPFVLATCPVLSGCKWLPYWWSSYRWGCVLSTPGCTDLPRKGDSIRLIHLYAGDEQNKTPGSTSALWALKMTSGHKKYMQQSILDWLIVTIIKRKVLVNYMIINECCFTGVSGSTDSESLPAPLSPKYIYTHTHTLFPNRHQAHLCLNMPVFISWEHFLT